MQPGIRALRMICLESVLPHERRSTPTVFLLASLAALLWATASKPETAESEAKHVSSSGLETMTQKEEAEFLSATIKEPRVGVVGLFIAPLMSLSVGYSPELNTLHEGLVAIDRLLEALEPWELTIVLWGCARLGISPGEEFLTKAKEQISKNVQEYGVEDATATLWALCVLDANTGSEWDLLMKRLSAFRISDFDEISVLHLVQAAMIHASSEGNSHSRSRFSVEPRASKMEVETVIAPLQSKVQQRCILCFEEYVPFHPYLEGSYMSMLFMMQKLHCFKEKGTPAAYKPYFGQISQEEIRRAQGTLQDTRKLSQIKRELFFHWRGNEVLDSWQQGLNEMVFLLSRRLGTPVVQPPDCDILLPQQRVAIFLEDNRPIQLGSSLSEATQSMLHLFGTETATPTAGFALHESSGTKLCKRRTFQRRGWRVVVIPLSVWNQLQETPEEKKRFLQEAIATGSPFEGFSSMLQSALNR